MSADGRSGVAPPTALHDDEISALRGIAKEMAGSTVAGDGWGRDWDWD
jgi:hypothetical protein